MDAKKRAVVIGALLHDIGKIGQRAQKKGELSHETINRESDICPGDGYSTHLHVLWTDEFFSKYFSDDLKDKIIGDVTFDFNPQNLASFHHKPASPLHRLIQIADRTSSGEREETERGDRDDYIKKRLSSIFNKVALQGEPKISEPYFYSLTPLTLHKTVFPKKKGELDGNSDIERYRDEYKVLWNGFIDDFKKLRDKTIGFNLGFQLFLNALYHLLMKYMWCVPSYTNAKNEVDNDISLFDHSRTTAAIASCLYDIYGEKEVPGTSSESEFLIVEGDISGIQKFLYKLAQPSGIAGVGRILRGRSMFLTLLPIVTANYIADKFDQTFVNILYAGGGNFQVLLPKLPGITSRLEEVAAEINKWLFDEFRGDLGLVIGYEEASRDNLGRNYGDVIDRLKTEMENRKSRKFSHRFFREEGDENFRLKQKDRLCIVCGSLDAETEEGICHLCDEHRKLGADIPKLRYLVLAKDSKEFQGGRKINFGKLANLWLLEDSIQDRDLNVINFQWAVNSTESILGFKFIGNKVPLATQYIGKSELGNKENEIGEYKEGTVISFDHLDLLADGDKKLGALRMDVDYLGLIFSIGLSKIEDNWGRSGLSISRAAMLSRMLDWFFTGYLNTVCEGLSKKLQNQSTDAAVQSLRSKVDCHFYIVYSGGDDVFIISPWDEAVELAFHIQNDLKEFAGYNNDINISGGLSIVKAKFPISRSGELAGEEEEKAKKERRSFSAFGEVGGWKKIEESLKFGKLLEKAIHGSNGKKLPRTFLNRVLEIRSGIIGLKEDDPKRFLHVPELVYSITRNVDQKLKTSWEGSEIWVKERLNEELVQSKEGLEKSGFGVKYALLKTRRR